MIQPAHCHPRALFALLLASLLAGCLTPPDTRLPTRTPAPAVASTATPTPQAVATIAPETAVELHEMGWITFTASIEGRRDVWLIRPDGSEEINLTGDFPNGFAEAPVWAPDGSGIAYDAIPNADVSRDIYYMTLAEREPFALTSMPGFDCYPSFSPDGTKLVYMSERDGNRDLFIIDMEGNELLQLTDHPGYDYEPAWSPDGEQIVFTSRRTGNSEIFIINADGTDLRQLTDQWGLDWRPSWSPDGEWIVFETWRNGNADIYMMRPDGSDVTQLTDNPSEDGHATFSPDGRYIVFHSSRAGNFQLFIMEFADPSNQWHLPTASPYALLPAWSPVMVVEALEGGGED
ncbi:MAG: PD40 domain-containing protein [Anaerolineales bacterium]|nr:PD40 domain-containing protein [Anaerolineales bacterium]